MQRDKAEEIIWKKISSAEAGGTGSAPDADKLWQRLDARNSKKTVRKIALAWYWAAAALILFAGVAAIFLQPNTKTPIAYARTLPGTKTPRLAETKAPPIIKPEPRTQLEHPGNKPIVHKHAKRKVRSADSLKLAHELQQMADPSTYGMSAESDIALAGYNEHTEYLMSH